MPSWDVQEAHVLQFRLQTELKYPSKNRRRFTQRYNMTKIIFSKRTICALFNFAVEELRTVCKRSVEAQVYYTKKKCFLRNIFTLALKTLCCGHMCSCNKHYYHHSYILACWSILWRTKLTKIMYSAFSNWMCYAYSTLHFDSFDFVRFMLKTCNNFSGQSLITIN